MSSDMSVLMLFSYAGMKEVRLEGISLKLRSRRAGSGHELHVRGRMEGSQIRSRLRRLCFCRLLLLSLPPTAIVFGIQIAALFDDCCKAASTTAAAAAAASPLL